MVEFKPLRTVRGQKETRLLVAACLRGDAAADPVELFGRFEERAAIRQYEGGEARPVAEREAMRAVARELGLHPSDLVRAWSLVPELYPRLRGVTFRALPSGDSRRC